MSSFQCFGVTSLREKLSGRTSLFFLAFSVFFSERNGIHAGAAYRYVVMLRILLQYKFTSPLSSTPFDFNARSQKTTFVFWKQHGQGEARMSNYGRCTLLEASLTFYSKLKKRYFPKLGQT